MAGGIRDFTHTRGLSHIETPLIGDADATRPPMSAAY